MITLQQLLEIMPAAKSRADVFLPYLNNAMQEFDISTAERQAAFLAQIAHESGQLRYVKELASGSAYEGRKSLGNILPGDGPKYKGRGLIQITGRLNYTKLMMALDIDCIEHPELVEQPENACRSAAWFWSIISGNLLADSGDFITITKRINGGLNGLADRQMFYNAAKKVLQSGR